MTDKLTKITAALTGLAVNVMALGNLFKWWDLTSDQMSGVILVLGNLFAVAALFIAKPTTPVQGP